MSCSFREVQCLSVVLLLGDTVSKCCVAVERYSVYMLCHFREAKCLSVVSGLGCTVVLCCWEVQCCYLSVVAFLGGIVSKCYAVTESYRACILCLYWPVQCLPLC